MMPPTPAATGPYIATVYRVMIASPSDVREERQIAQEVIANWNAANSEHHGIVLLPLMWERDATPAQGRRPQQIINEQVLARADMLVAMFWSRIGSPTGKAPSGTVEELTEHIKAGKPALLYFSDTPVSPSMVDMEQLEALRKFKQEARSTGLYETYESAADFQAKLAHQLSMTINTHPVFANATVTKDGRSTPSVYKEPVAPLSEKAVQLLRTSADDGGTIIVISNMRHSLVTSGAASLYRGTDRREMAAWEAAVEELVARDFARKRSDGHYALTHAGYSAAAEIEGSPA